MKTVVACFLIGLSTSSSAQQENPSKQDCLKKLIGLFAPLSNELTGIASSLESLANDKGAAAGESVTRLDTNDRTFEAIDGAVMKAMVASATGARLSAQAKEFFEATKAGIERFCTEAEIAKTAIQK